MLRVISLQLIRSFSPLIGGTFVDALADSEEWPWIARSGLGWLFQKYPYLLPNLVSCAFSLFGCAFAFFVLEEVR